MENGGSTDDDMTLALCKQVIDRMALIQEDVLLGVLNGKGEAAAGAMYARAFLRGLIELQDEGLRRVRVAHEVFGLMLGDAAGDDHT